MEIRMAFKSWNEFLNEQKGGKMPGATEEPKSKVKGSKLPSTYHAKGANQDRGLVTADDDRGTPLGEKGMAGMTPKNVQPYGQKPAGAPKKLKMSKGKMPGKKKMKTEAFLQATSDLSNAQFTATLMENTSIPKPKLHSLDGRKYTPEPAETMRYVVALALQNENMMSRLVREMKRNGGLEKLVSELFSHGELFSILAEAAATNPRINRKLNEAVAEPRGAGGSGIGPSGASAGNGPIVKNGGGMGGATPPGPPSEGEEHPEGGGDVLDDGGEGEEDDNKSDDLLDGDDDHDDDEEDDDDDDDEEDDDGKHTHIHIHQHHHHGGDEEGGEMGGDMGGSKPPMKGGGLKL
jgi:hypothetical protein